MTVTFYYTKATEPEESPNPYKRQLAYHLMHVAITLQACRVDVLITRLDAISM